MVRNGEGLTNLTLMRTLYWVFTLVLIAVGYGNMPLSMQLKQGFPENTVIGKMCLHMDFLFSKESFKSRLLGFAFPFLWLMYGYLWPKRVNRYISGQFLNQTTFSGLGGKYRRNIFTYAETLSYNSYWCCFIMLENSLLIVLEQYSEHISKEVRYNLHNIMCILFIDIFHGFYLPLKHIHTCHSHFSSSREEHNAAQIIKRFYVREPEIVPRRDHISSSHTICSITQQERNYDLEQENIRGRRSRSNKQNSLHHMAPIWETENEMPSVCD